jgi:hypothetical protein
MGKRRTRKQKKEALHQFSYTWKNEPKKLRTEANVKRQSQTPLEANLRTSIPVKMAVNQAQVYDLASVKKDIVRSLIIASLIFGAELVIYLAWNVN